MPRTRAWPAWLPLILVLLAADWLHAPALRLPFFADDYLFLDQARVRSLVATLRSRDPIGNFVRPVGRQIWFWVISRLGESPVVGHLMNLIAFLGILALLYWIARRLAGPRAAAIAASILALHYAADVPLRWVSGSQDLLATLGALGAIALFLAGRRALAALALALALLSKETVALTPLIAAAAARRPDQRWAPALRRAWPLALVTGVWGVVWATTLRHNHAAGVGFSVAAVPATFVHLIQVAAGLEWRRDDPFGLFRTLPPVVALAFALSAIYVSGPPPRRTAAASPGAKAGARKAARRVTPAQAPAAAPPRKHPLDPVGVGIGWAIAGALPVIAVASIWSAYYYLFALCGAALALGAWLRRFSNPVALLAVAALGWTSHAARQVHEFETGGGVWTMQSRVDRYYVDRAQAPIAQYLKELKRQLPTLPHGTTLYFAKVPGFIGWQAGDGPLVRWAYRDSSLHSYFATQFGDHLPPGAFYFFELGNDSLINKTEYKGMLLGLAIAELADEKFEPARRTLQLDLQLHPQEQGGKYLLGWTEMALGDTAESHRWLRAAGVTLAGGPTPEIEDARTHLAARDSAGAMTLLERGLMNHGLDPRVHADFADLAFARNPSNPNAFSEALVARLLAPQDATMWWRWSVMQAASLRAQMALQSLDRFYALATPQMRAQPKVAQYRAYLLRAQPGGEAVQTWLRKGGRVTE